MNFVEIILLGVALSLDTFAVSLSLGVASEKTTRIQKVRFLLVIGLFHTLMILLGWFMGENMSRIISVYDHWVAFVLLAFVGGKMIKEGMSHRDDMDAFGLLSLRNTLMLGIALSLDALITGFSIGLIKLMLIDASQFTNIVLASLIIGFLAAAISTVGIFVGKKVSACMSSRAEIFGGIILIIIGIKVLFEHDCFR